MVRLLNNVLFFKNQKFDEIKKLHQGQGTLFVDHTFPALDAVIGTTSIPSGIAWKRPGELTNNPRLFADVEKSRSVRPGELSCNWMVSALAVLAGVSELRHKVIPDYWDQEWGEHYCGAFRFRFWRFGKWVEVVVDDYLPTANGKILVTQASYENEFWTALVEKAYAKLNGSWDALREGELCDALVDFTGGVSEVVDIQAEQYAEIDDKRVQFLDSLIHEVEDHTIICFTVTAPTESDIGTKTELGLTKGHAYHVTDVKKVYFGETSLRNLFKGREKVAMVRLRDPRLDSLDTHGTPKGKGNEAQPTKPEIQVQELEPTTEDDDLVQIQVMDKTEDWKPRKPFPHRLEVGLSPGTPTGGNKKPPKGILKNRSPRSPRSKTKLQTPFTPDPVVQLASTASQTSLTDNGVSELVEDVNEYNNELTRSVSRLRSKNQEWLKVQDSERRRLGLTFRDASEFWMPLDDVVSEFSDVTFCRLVVENLFAAPLGGRRWKSSGAEQGSWSGHHSAGGDIEHEGFMNNPQYTLDIHSDTEILIQLLQYIDTTHAGSGFVSPETRMHLLIGFHIIKVEENRATRLHKMWPHYNIIVSHDHRRKREVNYKGHLYKGRYILLPSTYKAGDESLYFLRLFSKGNVSLKELTEEVPKSWLPLCACILPDYDWVTVVTINTADSLMKPPTWGSTKIKPYCVVECEGTKVKTEILGDESEPTWNCSFIFFRKHTEKPLKVQVYTHNALFPDELIGECELPALVNHTSSPLTAALQPKSKLTSDTDEVLTTGNLHLTILTEDNLRAV